MPETIDVTIDVTEFDLHVGVLRNQAGTLAERLRAAASSLRRDIFADSLELETPIDSYASACRDLQSRLGLPSGGPRTFTELDVYRQPLFRMHEARGILDAVERLQPSEKRTAAAETLCAAIRVRIDGVRAKLAGPDADELAKLIVERRHPVNDLSELVHAGESLDDERWDSLAQSVEQFFGREIAIAAIRGRLRPEVTESAELRSPSA